MSKNQYKEKKSGKILRFSSYKFRFHKTLTISDILNQNKGNCISHTLIKNNNKKLSVRGEKINRKKDSNTE